MSKEEKKPLYAVHIMRRDNQHISALETTDYDKAYETYESHAKQWAECVKTSTPFSLKSPVVTSFDPGLIYEITILPIVAEQNLSKYDNPYHQKMIKEGFGNTFPKSDLLDSGYR